MINLDKINPQFDINNIDPAQLVKLLSDNQKIVVSVIAIVALVIAGSMFNDFHAKASSLHAQMTQEQSKLDAIKARDTAVNDLNSFKAAIPKELTVFDLVTLISNFAKSNNVTIASYTPSQTKDMGLYDEIDVHFDLASDDFKAMMIFLKQIERSKYPVMIHSWIGHEDDSGKIIFKIAISAMLIHP